MIYIASPFRTHDEKVEESRVEAAEKYVAALIEMSLIPFSAVVYAAALIKKHELTSDLGYWKKFLYEFLKSANEVHVLKIAGWEDSEGIDWEIEMARELDISVVYIDI